MNKFLVLRIAVGGLALYGAVSALAISHLHMTGAALCPTLGPLPACYIVFAGYALMAVAAARPTPKVFYTGWIPVFLLAAAGVGLEITSAEPVCPRSDGGIPKCYFSFALSSLLGLLGWAMLKKRQ